MRNFIGIICLLIASNLWAQNINVVNLKCEYLTNPLGIDVIQPRLSWQINAPNNIRNIEQQAYEIIVASSRTNIDKNIGDIWQSGRQASSQSVLVNYNGKPLQSSAYYYWKVKVHSNKGVSGWSNTAFWSMGMLDKQHWLGKWIGYDNSFAWDSVSQWARLSARYFRKEFTSASKIKRATAFISGLGLYELYLNGKKAGNDVLAPAPADYRKSAFYNTYDVTALVQQGKNAIGVVVGNGRYFTMRQNYKPHKINNFGYPKLLLQLEIEYTDGRKSIITTDETWKFTADGPIRSNNEYDGEEYDATKELTGWNKTGYNETDWLPVHIVTAPAGNLRSQMIPGMKIMQLIQPVSIKEIAPGKYIMDMGQNFSGWVKLRVQGKRGTQVQLKFAESLQPDGSLYTANLRDARVTDIYTLKGGAVEEWRPSFVYHGFRYVEITGFPGKPALANFTGELVFDEMKTTGHLTTDNATVNAILKNAWWGIASNYKGMPVDCPQRNERQPWLGDRATGAGGESFLFDNAALYAKWLNDIEDAQTPEGAIPDVAPAFWNYYSDNVTWPGTYILVADMLYRQFADTRNIIKHYPSMKKWMDYMRGRFMKNYIVTKDKYGDWCVPPESLELIRSKDSTRTTDGELLATSYYYKLLQLMKGFAVISNQATDTVLYNELLVNIHKAFNDKFFNASKNNYSNNTVTANLLPLYFGMVAAGKEKAVFENIYNKLAADNFHISTGVIGTQWLLRGLSKYNKPQTAYTLAANTTYPSWGYMVQQGATTIWELWNGNTANPEMNSQNHVMLLGDLVIWLYENAGGIKANRANPGFKEIIMQPEFNSGLQSVKAGYQSVYGTITSNWHLKGKQLQWEVAVPANTTALLYIPAVSVQHIFENNKNITTLDEFKIITPADANGNIVLQAGSGNYTITATLNQ